MRGAIETLGADRIRHGIRSVEDPSVLEDLAGRQIVCDVCPVSNLRTGAVPALDDHPLAEMLAAGVLCSISTDDPAMFGTDLDYEYRVAADLGCSSETAFRGGVIGALCDERTRSGLREIGDSYSWPEDSLDGGELT